MTKSKKWSVLVAFGLVILVGAWQGLRYWWLHNYSSGSRTGVIRKVSVKGPPVCKYLSAEMVLIGSAPGVAPQIWEFTVMNDSPGDPLVAKLHDAETSGKQVTVDYQQNKARWWACAHTEYYATKVE
jgi:hypothetical protein